MSGSSVSTVGFCILGLVFSSAGLRAGEGVVDLEWRPDVLSVGVGETAEIGLFAVAAVGDNIAISGLQAILAWDPGFLELAGHIDDGQYGWLQSGFPNDSGLDDLNAGLVDPPLGVPNNDGDAFYTALGRLGDPPVIDTDALLVTTMRFHALAVTDATQVCIPEMAGDFTESAVFANWPITGELGCATITVTPEPTTLVWFALLIPALTRRSRRF